jgi:phosphoenolpyruvate carboxykinase (GTP)
LDETQFLAGGGLIYPMKNEKLNRWVREVAELCQPDEIYWCDGTREEYDRLMGKMVANGRAIPLRKRRNCFLFRSDPEDVARLEARTFVATPAQDQVGPTNNWVNDKELKRSMTELYRGCMRGRMMYIIPFSMGPMGSPLTKLSVEITDSAYVVCNMHIMTRVGEKVIERLNQGEDFIPCLHSVGSPLKKDQKDALWPCAPIEKKFISHFPGENLIWSFGSGYGGNALLGKKCLALRLASAMGKQEGWWAEHMIILRLTSPEGRRYHIAAAFPSACGKTNLAMIQPTIPGWKGECLGDDIAWMKIGAGGRLYAINPEAGFFGVAPGTSYHSNPMAMETLKENVIFTNCALTDEGDIWWEGMNGSPAHAIDWQGRDWTPESGKPAAHPNARFTAPASQCPIICPDWEKPEGVPLDIFIFGGRRSTVAPLVREALHWDHGVFLAATAASEPTAAILDKVGIRYDPFAMLPFCAYNMADYFGHWLDMGDRLESKAPRIFCVNWFRKSSDGRWLWPGFGENSRPLKWMCERVDGMVGAKKTPIGFLPDPGDLDLTGLDLPKKNLRELLGVDREGWKAEIPLMEEFFAQFGDRLPRRLKKQLAEFKRGLG